MTKKHPIKVCMLSFRHGLLDDRIYKKEAITLKKNGYDVTCIGYGEKNEEYISNDGIKIIQLARRKKGNYLESLFFTFQYLFLNEIFNAAKQISANIYHIHDIELCRIACKLRRLPQKPKVIYDAHEPYFSNFKDYWKNRSFFRILLSDIPSLFAEKMILKKVDYLIATEENVASSFRKKNANTSIIYNYSFSCLEDISTEEKIYDAVYCGSLLNSKGMYEMIDLLIFLKKESYNLTFLFIGDFHNPQLKKDIAEKIIKNELQQNVIFTGNIPFETIGSYYKKSKISLCLFPFNRTNQLILPIKLFEYMAYGLPIIGSNFGHIKEIIELNNVGLTVNPENTAAAANAFISLLQNQTYKQYSSHCITIAKEKYTWESQEPILLNIYASIF